MLLTRQFICGCFLTGVVLMNADYCSAAAGDRRAKAESLANLGLEAAQKGDYAKAIEHMDEAIRVDPKWDAAYYNRAYIYCFYKSDFTKAINDCNTGIELASKPYPNSYILRGLAYRLTGEFGKAQADVKKAIELEPKNPEHRVSLGCVFSEARQWDKAIAEFTQACKIDPRCYTALAYRGSAYREKQDFDKALADLNEAIRLKPAEKLAYVYRAKVFYEKEDDDNSLKDCNYVLKAKPASPLQAHDYAQAFCVRGMIYAGKRENEKASADFSEAIRLAPKFAQPYLERAVVLGGEEQFAKAVTDLTEFIRLEPNEPQGYEFRAKAYFALGDLKRSAADEKKAAELRDKK